jgi:GNAT superfamily N-acetyltransferase
MAEEWRRGEFAVSTDPSMLDLQVVQTWLSESSYWVPGIPFDVVQRAVEGSLNFGLYADGGVRTIGLARIITDYATFAYVCDVFVLDEYRGQGLGVWLMECVAAHPRLQGFRRWMLGTKDAHELYKKTGFTPLAAPERWMEKADPEIYRSGPHPAFGHPLPHGERDQS